MAGMTWLQFFSQSEEITHILEVIISVFYWIIPAETYQTTFSSILRACGFEKMIFYLYFLILYVLSGTLIVVLAFTWKMKAFGLMLSIAIATWVFMIIEILVYV